MSKDELGSALMWGLMVIALVVLVSWVREDSTDHECVTGVFTQTFLCQVTP